MIPITEEEKKEWLPGAEKRVRTIINLDDRIRIANKKLKSQVGWIDSSREAIRVGFKRPSPEIARVGRVNGLVIQHDAHKTFTPVALVKVGSPRQLIGLADYDGQVLIHARRMLVGGGIDFARLIELVSEVGTVTRRTNRVFSILCVGGNPRGKAAFEAAVLHNVVRWTGGASSARR